MIRGNRKPFAWYLAVALLVSATASVRLRSDVMEEVYAASIGTAKADIATLKGGTQAGIEAKTIEKRGAAGEVLARLQVSPGQSLGEFRFDVEDFQSRATGRASGAGQITPAGLTLQFIEARANTRLDLDVRPDPAATGRVRSTLSLNHVRYGFTIDVDRAKALAQQMQKLLAEGKKQEAAQVGSQFRETLSPGRDYLAFVSQVANSAVLDLLNTTASLLATATPEEIGKNPALSVMRSAVRTFAPSSVRSAGSNQTIGQVQQPQIVRVSHIVKGSNRRAGPISSAQASGVCCSACLPSELGGIIGCAFFDYECRGNVWLPGWGCDVVTVVCIGAVVYYAIWCSDSCNQDC